MLSITNECTMPLCFNILSMKKLPVASICYHCIYWPVPKWPCFYLQLLWHVNSYTFSKCAKSRNDVTIGFKVMDKKPILDVKFRISLRQSWKKRLAQSVLLWWKSLPPFPPIQCWSESSCQEPRQVAQHWLMGGGEGYDKWEVRWLL